MNVAFGSVETRPGRPPAAVALLLLVVGSFVAGAAADCVQPVTDYATTDNQLTAVGTQSNYTCFAGFKFPNGAAWSVFTCLANGSWSPIGYSCLWPCSPLIVGNATLSFAAGAGVRTVVTAACNTGYRYPDSAKIKTTNCQNSGQWSSVLPAGCLAVQCPQFEAKNSTPSTYSCEYPVAVNYTCDTSPEQLYFPDGSKYRITACSAFGDWTQTIPPCVPYDQLPQGAIEHVKTQVEAEHAVSITTILIGIIGTILGVILVLDLATFPRQFYFMKKNIHSRFPSCCKGVEKEEEEKTIMEDLISIKSSVTKSLSSLRNVKVTPSPSVADMDSIRGGGAHEHTKESDPLVNFLVTGSGEGVAESKEDRAVDASRRRIASARESVRRALEKTSVGKKLVKVVDAYRNKFGGGGLPLGSGNSSNPIGPPIETINEAYEEGEEVYDDDGSDDGSYTDGSDDDAEDNGGRRSHMNDIAVHEV